MTLLNSLVKDLDSTLYGKARSLNLRKKGFSRGHMRDCRAQKHEHSRLILAMDSARLLGWALLVQCLDTAGSLKEYSINFYVRHDARRVGVGKALFAATDETLVHQGRVGHVAIWSPDSEKFYTRNTSPRIRVIQSPRYTLQFS